MATNYDLNNTGPEVQERLDQVMPNKTDISQEVLRAQGLEAGLQRQIDEIVLDNATVNITVSPAVVYADEAATIHLAATTDTEAAISIKQGETVIAEGEGFSLNGDEEITPTVGDVNYVAEFIIRNLMKSVSKTVKAVRPIFYGCGEDYTDATTKASPRTSPAGTYNVTVGTTSAYVFFVVPATMTIHAATMSGFDFPLNDPVEVEIEDVAYKSYKSANTYDVGELTIIIS